MPLIFRVMTLAHDGLPAVGATRCKLGVRILGENADISVDSAGNVHPNTEGMSVSPSLETLPRHLVPRKLKNRYPGARGNNGDQCWQIGEGVFLKGPLTADLVLVPETGSHGFVEPARTMSIESYQQALANTRTDWVPAKG